MEVAGIPDTECTFFTQIEQNPEDWWDAFVKSVSALNSCHFCDIQGISLTGHMQDLILLDHDNVPVRPAILYSDSRASVEAIEIIEKNSIEELESVSGPWTGASGLLAKIAWLQRHEPSSLSSATSILVGAHGYICARLCGAIAADYTTASTTGLLCLSECRWSSELLAAAGFPDVSSKLPKLLLPTVPAGRLLPQIAAALAIPADIPVFHGCGDVAATTIGAGSRSPSCPHETPPFAPAPRPHSLPCIRRTERIGHAGGARSARGPTGALAQGAARRARGPTSTWAPAAGPRAPSPPPLPPAAAAWRRCCTRWIRRGCAWRRRRA